MASNAGHTLERLTAAALQQSGYFVERNCFGTSSKLFELDVAATHYTPTPIRCLIETTTGADGTSKSIRRLAGDLMLFGFDRAVYATPKEIDGRWHAIVARHPMSLVQITDDQGVIEALRREGLCTRWDGAAGQAWIAAYEVIDAFRQTVRRRAQENEPSARELKARLAAIEGEVWLEPDPIERLRMLEICQHQSSITMEIARAHYEKATSNHAMAALNDPEELYVNAAAYVQHLERLNFAKAVIDAALHCTQNETSLIRLGDIREDSPSLRFPYLVEKTLPALDHLRYAPSVLQILLFGLGGWISEDDDADELLWIASQAGCDTDVIHDVIEWFEWVVAYSRGWWRAAPGARLIKWYPLHLHAVGYYTRKAVFGSVSAVGEFQCSVYERALSIAIEALDDPIQQARKSRPKRPADRPARDASEPSTCE